jgi:hypothetical protein
MSPTPFGRLFPDLTACCSGAAETLVALGAPGVGRTAL